MKCPYCLEEIQDGALLCKHCKTVLNETSTENIIETDNTISSKCPDCGEEIKAVAKKCIHCGSEFMHSAAIRKELMKYNKITKTNCLGCGYEGDMGVINTMIPWYCTWWFILFMFISAVFLKVTIVPAFVLLFGRFFWSKDLFLCPSCGVTLKER